MMPSTKERKKWLDTVHAEGTGPARWFAVGVGVLFGGLALVGCVVQVVWVIGSDVQRHGARVPVVNNPPAEEKSNEKVEIQSIQLQAIDGRHGKGLPDQSNGSASR